MNRLDLLKMVRNYFLSSDVEENSPCWKDGVVNKPLKISNCLGLKVKVYLWNDSSCLAHEIIIPHLRTKPLISTLRLHENAKMLFGVKLYDGLPKELTKRICRDRCLQIKNPPRKPGGCPDMPLLKKYSLSSPLIQWMEFHQM